MAKKYTLAQWKEELKVVFDGVEYDRHIELIRSFETTFGEGREISLFSAPGRTEIGGNHTDHQNGCVLAAAVDLDTVAAVSLNGENVIRIQSQGYPLCTVDLNDLRVRKEEENTTPALIRGVAAAFSQMGCRIQGFDAYVVSNVLRGSGLSSSAAFEVLMGVILNGLFFDGRTDAVKIAQIGQYAENVYFGKPCGLMDQMASSVGNLVFIDFCDPKDPAVRKINFDFSKTNHSLCIIDSGADHADLTEEYAAIPGELKTICGYFGKSVLREVPRKEFYAAIPQLRKLAGDRAVLRGMHFYDEDQRVCREAEALGNGDFDQFLKLVGQSGQSSWMYLQNVIPAGSTKHQEVALALALCREHLAGRGAYRVHGGGFAGTVQAFVPNDILDSFQKAVEAVLGQGSCHVLSIRPVGGMAF